MASLDGSGGSLSQFFPLNALADSSLEMKLTPTNVQIDIRTPNLRMPMSTEAPQVAADFTYRWTGTVQPVSALENIHRNLAALRENMLGDHQEGRHQLVASSIAVSTGLSVGYVIWLVRGGALLGSMLSSMPLWNMVDPLPVLNRAGPRTQEQSTDGEDESVERLFDGDDHRDTHKGAA